MQTRAQNSSAGTGRADPLSFDCRSFDALLALPGYVAVFGMDRRARAAAELLAGVFKAEIRRHRDEQENGLFLSLRRGLTHERADAEAVLAGLVADHEQLEAAWRNLEGHLAAIEFCRRAALPLDDVTAFVERFQRHLQDEDKALRWWLEECGPGGRAQLPPTSPQPPQPPHCAGGTIASVTIAAGASVTASKSEADPPLAISLPGL